MKATFLFLSIQLGIYGSIAVCQTQPKQIEWKEYVYPSAGFAITLPFDPKPHDDPINAGYTGKIGWHTLRHTDATVLEQMGARMKVAQELLRHADIQTSMNVYTGAMEKDKREAANRVAHAVLGQVQ